MTRRGHAAVFAEREPADMQTRGIAKVLPRRDFFANVRRTMTIERVIFQKSR